MDVFVPIFNYKSLFTRNIVHLFIVNIQYVQYPVHHTAKGVRFLCEDILNNANIYKGLSKNSETRDISNIPLRYTIWLIYTEFVYITNVTQVKRI